MAEDVVADVWTTFNLKNRFLRVSSFLRMMSTLSARPSAKDIHLQRVTCMPGESRRARDTNFFPQAQLSPAVPGHARQYLSAASS